MDIAGAGVGMGRNGIAAWAVSYSPRSDSTPRILVKQCGAHGYTVTTVTTEQQLGGISFVILVI